MTAPRRNPDFDAVIGARIRARRLKIGMDESTFGDKIGVGTIQVWRIEKGKCSIVLCAAFVIADALGTTIGALTRGISWKEK